ncbi:MAG: ABC transporter ATP-binding protein [Deltaproteobacteria bacterium]|nr:ABC transporter ATP-binding protein [Deltaproteobacteria bacterium]MBW1934694.1 ABC transporter ATP-binding protein [Deltaproteobacteria bacterium]RLB35113.1 MAG: ABC transporter ATP-binding protein [Deltaproteobacteria bacterium]
MLERILGKELAYYVRAHKTLLICSLVLTALSAIFVVVPAYLLQPFIDEGMKTGSSPATWKIPWIVLSWNGGLSWHRTQLVIVEQISPNRLLVLLTLVALASVLLKSATVYLSQLAAAAFSNRAIRSLRVDLFDKFTSLPLSFYHRRKQGELISRATADLTVMQDRVANILIGLVQHPLTALAFLAYLLIMNYKLTLLVFVAVPIIVGVVRLFGRKVKKHSRRVQDDMSKVTSAYQEMLLCIKVVQGFCRNEGESRKFRVLADRLYKSVMHWYRWQLGLGPMMDSTVFLILPGVLIVGKIYFHHTLGELMSLLYAFSRLYAPLKNLARVSNELRTLQGATERVFGIMKTTPDIKERPGAIVLPRHQESIEFDRVSFSYEPGVPVLKDISFKITAGEMVAFVGSTGAGKSTLLELIPRFYDVKSGSIRIDGIDIREVTLDSLRRQISTVSQEVLLFHDTIANNIKYSDPSKSEEDVIQAAKVAHAHHFIMAQPAGYKSVVGDRGTLLSGGQRQRIAIARAILANPSILILDEAASALDAESERFIQEAIQRLRGGRTILVAAHRLSTIAEADWIYVLEDGRIVESGTHTELMTLSGRFRQLHDIQFRA